MELTLAYSTCPNDTFIFEALVHGRVDTEGLHFRVVLEDILELNARARAGRADVCKVSFLAYAQLQDRWTLLPSGAALGRGVGPLLVARSPLSADDLATAQIGIPGWDTTAHLLFHRFAPQAQERRVLRFDQIMPAVARGELDAGVIIHESRFTYKQWGLQCLADLGAHWEADLGVPIPLGGIIAQQALGPDIHAKLARSIRRSLAFARAQPHIVQPYVAAHAQEMAADVMQQHIDLYVNDFSLDLGPEGQQAVKVLLAEAPQMQAFASHHQP
jgi:1,4-dihydroxy-6-naphthoate synthase